MKTKPEIILEIKERIEAEYKKHKSIDWTEIAAKKIYSTLFPVVDNCPVCQSIDLFSFNLMHYKCRKCENKFTY